MYYLFIKILTTIKFKAFFVSILVLAQKCKFLLLSINISCRIKTQSFYLYWLNGASAK